MAKLSASERKKFLLRRLEEQRHLLKKSIEAMAAGDLLEALRVATSVRVLVHETGSSKPLLKQLTHNYLELPILDRIEERPRENTIVFYCPVSAQISTDGKVSLITDLDSPRYVLSRLCAWW